MDAFLSHTDYRIMIRKTVITLLGGLFGVLLYLFLSYQSEQLTSHPIEFYSIFSLAGVIGAWGLVVINRRCNTWMPWRKGVLYRLIIGYFVQMIYVSVITLILYYLVINWVISDQVGDEFVFSFLIKLSIINTLGLVIYNVIYFAYYSYHEYAVVQIENIANERRQLELQLEALKSQLKPHYLFNSLNTISSLLYKDATLTERFIRRLAETYQYILSTQQLRYVTLAEEIDFVKSYHFLLKVRFEENIFLEINLPASLMNTKMPPLTLQILVENAIKHNIVNKESPLYIYISAIDNTVLRIVNTKTEKPLHTTSFNIGLKNVKRRYHMLVGSKVKVRDENKFTVELPVIIETALSA